MTEPSQVRPEEPVSAPAEESPVVRDNRKIRSAGDQARSAAGESPPAGPAAGTADPSAAGGAAPEGTPPDGGPPEHPPAEPGAPAAQPGTGPDSGLGAELAALRTALDERTRDAQRVAAEFANYKKRVERDRTAAAEEATAAVFRALLPVLDDLDRAREHGELSEGVAATADQLVAAVGKFGLHAFGEKGDRFDPTRHEAVAHLTSDDVAEPTCVDVLRRGYLLGDGLLRPAMVAVATPADTDPEPDPAPTPGPD